MFGGKRLEKDRRIWENFVMGKEKRRKGQEGETKQERKKGDKRTGKKNEKRNR